METILNWHYFKDELPEIGKEFIKYDGKSVMLNAIYASMTDKEKEEYVTAHVNEMWAYIKLPAKEFHVWLDNDAYLLSISCCFTFETTEKALRDNEDIIHTTQTAFLKTSILDDYRLFVHKNNKYIEITLGECQGTERFIRPEHNLERLVLGGEFDFGD